MKEKKHCKWYSDEGICTNGESPCVADYCPVIEYPEMCEHRENVKARSKKVLTDEEVLKAWNNCGYYDGCPNCPLFRRD